MVHEIVHIYADNTEILKQFLLVQALADILRHLIYKTVEAVGGAGGGRRELRVLLLALSLHPLRPEKGHGGAARQHSQGLKGKQTVRNNNAF